MVDNSIDASNDEGVEIYIVLNKKDEKIIIKENNGKGMNKEIASKSLHFLPHSKKHDAFRRIWLRIKISIAQVLGQFLRSQALPKGSEVKIFALEYNEEKFLQSSGLASLST